MTIMYLVCGLAGLGDWYQKGNLIIDIISIMVFGVVAFHIWDYPISKKIKRLEEKLI